MCLICDNEYTKDTIEIVCCIDVDSIPDILVNLVTLYCDQSSITTIPDTLVNLVYFYCSRTLITAIPDTLVNLVTLDCGWTQISSLPDTLINLVTLICYDTQITTLPSTLKHIKYIYSDNKPFVILYKYKFNGIDIDFKSRYKKLMKLYKILPTDIYRHYKYYF